MPMATRGGRSAHGGTTMVLLLLVVATLLVAAAAPESTKITMLVPPAVPDDAWVVRHIAAAKRNASGTLPSRRRGLQGECHSPDVCNPLPPAVTDYGRTHPSCVPGRDDKRCCRMTGLPVPFAWERQFPVAMHGVAGEVCAPECINGECPSGAALPPGTLAKPQCVVRACSDATFCERGGGPAEGRLCALTCDPDAVVLEGQSNCQPGASCQRVPDADFSPPGICTFTTYNMPPEEPLADYDCKPGTSGATQCRNNCTVPPPPPPPAPAVRWACDSVNFQCFASPGGDSSSQEDCAAECVAPTPPPPPTPPRPPQPLSTSPCLRFIHALPVGHTIDVQITQQDGDTVIAHTFTNYSFGDYSDWINVFVPGSGSITIWENVNGVRGQQVFEDDGIHLTPGPLVVAVKVAQDQNPAEPSQYWPPSDPDQIETIAASYIPPAQRNSSSVLMRMMNLAPNIIHGGMTSSAAAAAPGGGASASTIANVHYSDSSAWVPLPAVEQSFTFWDDDLSPHREIFKTSPPSTPPSGIGSTQFLIGLDYKQSGLPLGLRALLLRDAPEDGLCKPSGQ